MVKYQCGVKIDKTYILASISQIHVLSEKHILYLKY